VPNAAAAVVEAVKLADDRSGDVVVRLSTRRSAAGPAPGSPPPSTWPAGRVCDLLEREDAEVAALAPISVRAGTVDLALAPFQVITLRLRPARTQP
jgi:alpha-mannosidase